MSLLTTEREALQKARNTEKAELEFQVSVLSAEREAFRKAVEGLNSELAGQDHLKTEETSLNLK